jgi:hypothetical protein
MSLCGRGKEFVERIHWIRQVPWNQLRIIRAGVIPYVVIDNHIFFCLGVDKKSRDLTDFAGGIRESDSSPLAGAIREFREESKDVFGEENYREEAYIDSLCLIKRIPFKDRNDSYHMMIIFHEVDESYLSGAMDDFARKDITARDEVSAIAWFSENPFKQLVYTPENTRMYNKVKKFIANSISNNRLMYFLKLRSSLKRNNPGFGESLVLKASVANTDSMPWFEEPTRNNACYFKRRRVMENRPRFNLSNYNLQGLNTP